MKGIGLRKGENRVLKRQENRARTSMPIKKENRVLEKIEHRRD